MANYTRSWPTSASARFAAAHAWQCHHIRTQKSLFANRERVLRPLRQQCVPRHPSSTASAGTASGGNPTTPTTTATTSPTTERNAQPCHRRHRVQHSPHTGDHTSSPPPPRKRPRWHSPVGARRTRPLPAALRQLIQCCFGALLGPRTGWHLNPFAPDQACAFV
jgi:hypothetical protein